MRTTLGRLTAAGLAVLAVAGAARADELVLKDPKGDDKGPGGYTYPTDAVYTPGSFDLREVRVADKGDALEVSVQVGARIEDPWGSKSWQGNGFSLQMVFLFIDTDHKAGSGHRDALPGLNVRFADDGAWDKALIISPQGNSRLQAEIDAKAKAVKGDIVLPTSVRAQGTTLVARFPKDKLGAPQKGWGWQVLMQSNEGYPDKKDLLTRKVNEYHGAHKFGGGHDYDCDPHVIDMLAGAAQGGDGEKAAQFTALKAYQCDDDDPEKGTWAVIPMVYPK